MENGMRENVEELRLISSNAILSTMINDNE